MFDFEMEALLEGKEQHPKSFVLGSPSASSD
jgi:hypothetical protein